MHTSYLSVCLSVYTRTNARTHALIHTHTRAHTHSLTHTHTHTHTFEGTDILNFVPALHDS